MGLTRLQLEDRCIQYGFGELDRTRFTDFLNQRYRDVLGRHRWSWNRTVSTVSLTAGTNSITLDNDAYIYFGRLRPLAVGVREPAFVEYDSRTENEFTRRAFDSTYRGQPSSYTIITDTIIFDKFADVQYQYESNVWPLPSYMTSAGSEVLIPDEDREVLVAGALMDACLRDKDFTGAKIWNDLYESRINSMWAKDRANNNETDLRIEMPGHYYGVFGR